MEKVKILFLSANPHTTTTLQLDEEVRAITQKIRAAEFRESLSLVSAWAVRADDLLQLLNEHKPHIVHFSGHGSSDGEIMLVNDKGASHNVNSTALTSLFVALKDNVRVVVLNACYSRAQAEAITSVIDCVIGMNSAIGDRAAAVFAASFYRAVGFGRSVQESFEQGKVALMLDGVDESSTPELITKAGVDASVLRLVTDSSGHSRTLAATKGLNIVDVHVVDDRHEIIEFRETWLSQSNMPPREMLRPLGVVRERGLFPLIDIKVRNTSDAPAFLKRLEFKVNACRAVPDPLDYSAYPVSWEYNVLLNPHVQHDRKTLELSQMAGPNDVDRFIVVVGHKHGYGELDHAAYNVTLTLFYNEMQSVDLGTFDIKVRAPVYFVPPEPSSIVQIPAALK
jgi:hypothetical protein